MHDPLLTPNIEYSIGDSIAIEECFSGVFNSEHGKCKYRPQYVVQVIAIRTVPITRTALIVEPRYHRW